MTDEDKQIEEISAAFTRYYDSFTEQEMAEDRAWGDFAWSQFVSHDGPSA